MGKLQACAHPAQFRFKPTAIAYAVAYVALSAMGVAALTAAPAAYAADGADTAALPTVTVTSATTDQGLLPAYAGGQVARGGSLGVLGTSDVMDTPFSTMNYTAETLANQQARTLADVVENEASVRNTNAAGGFGDSFMIRGYSVSADDVGLNGLYGLASTAIMPVALIERVEVLKGPGALMSGMALGGSVGGGINIVTKRAGDEPLTRVTGTYESKGQFGTQMDVSRRFGENKEWGIRVNGQYKDGETNIVDSNQKQTLAAVALDYTGARLRWTLDAFEQTGDTQNLRSQYSATGIPAAPSGHSTAFVGNALTFKDSVLASRLEYDISDKLTVYGAFGYHEGWNNQTFPSGSVDASGNIAYSNPYYDAVSKTTTADVGLRARLNTFGIGHTMTLGATQVDRVSGYSYDGADSGTTTIYNPSTISANTIRSAPLRTGETKLSSMSLSDTLSIANGRLLITGGVRKQQVESLSYDASGNNVASKYSASTYSPLLGIVVKPLSNVSVYGNYSTGLQAGTTVAAGYANVGQVLAPYKSKQYETGVKVDWGRVTTSLAVFQIGKPNGVANTATNIYAYSGQQRNRGLELAAYGEAAPGVRLMASGTFYNAKQTNTQDANDGKQANGVPRRTFNLGGDWDTPWLKGLSLNARALYTSSIYVDAANTLSVPSWIRYDLGARYNTIVAGKPVVFRATVQNLLNKNYWLTTDSYGYLTVAAARTLLLSAQVDF